MEAALRHEFPRARNPRSAHCEQVWDQYRQPISRLYLDENKPLKQVMDTMLHTYGFRAS